MQDHQIKKRDGALKLIIVFLLIIGSLVLVFRQYDRLRAKAFSCKHQCISCNGIITTSNGFGLCESKEAIKYPDISFQ